MTKLEILNTGFTWNWLHTLNQVLDGTMFGLGLILALALFNLLSGNKDKKKETTNA